MNKLSPLSRFAACLLVLAASGAHAQSSCDSDKQPRPVALLERFISADCESCWADPATPRAGRGELVVDWIVPGNKGDDAPLSAAASRDALIRLEALQRPAPAQADAMKHRIAASGRQLRVAHGLAFNGYVGASIGLKPGARGPWRAWLLLVETVPAGTEGSPVERNLVRNVFQPAWDGTGLLSKTERWRLFESRPMSIPEGAKPKRLRVIGLLEDARGRVVAAAASRCRAPQN